MDVIIFYPNFCWKPHAHKNIEYTYNKIIKFYPFALINEIADVYGFMCMTL